MKTKKRIFLFAFGVLFFVGTHTVNAQVTIGGEIPPVTGATLDLSPTGGYKGGLKLPSVELTSLTEIPTGAKGFTEGATATKSELVGTVVYNASGSLGTGMYMWDGTKWQAMFSAGAGSLLNSIYPVGSIYITMDTEDPSVTIGGTWERIGQGRTLVGVDENDADFDVAGYTDGEKTHTLTIAEMPSHTHNTNAWHAIGAHMSYERPLVSGNGTGVDGGGSKTANFPTVSTGGNADHNNLQPYITCYMWKRTN